MKTIYSSFNEETCLLIQGARAKPDENGSISDPETLNKIASLIAAFVRLIDNNKAGHIK